MLTDAVADRFWAKVQKGPDCWLWTASTGTSGYGLGDQGQNMRDMIARNRRRHARPRGELSSSVRLTAEQVAFIRHHKEVTQEKMAEQFGVAQTTISAIRRGRTWTETYRA
jgi:DNA-binding XRE family transcriptional regulator